MDVNEIIQYVELSSAKSVIIDRNLMKNYLGYVRESVIMNGFVVRLEFNVYNHEYGGLKFYFKYTDYKALILSLEDYLGKKIENWENISKSGFYPFLKDYPDIEISSKALKHDFLNDKLVLPKNYLEKSLPEGYWKDLYSQML